MRMILDVVFPMEPFNTMVRKGVAGETIRKIMDVIKPEAAYFTDQDGHRGAILIVDLPAASAIPTIAEPWFLEFSAKCTFRVCMTPHDLAQSSLDKMK